MQSLLDTKAIKDQIRAQVALAEAAGKKETRTYEEEDADAELQKEVIEATYQSFYDIAKKALSKGERSEQFSEIKENYISKFSEEELEEKGALISRYSKEAQKKAVRDLVLNEGARLDGRKTTDIRPIWCEVDYLPFCTRFFYFYSGRNASFSYSNPRDIKRSQHHRSTHRARRRTLLFAL
jgi:polyribonucleotide nucleotidyltransferase